MKCLIRQCDNLSMPATMVASRAGLQRRYKIIGTP
jgi:hypothetical protein